MKTVRFPPSAEVSSERERIALPSELEVLRRGTLEAHNKMEG